MPEKAAFRGWKAQDAIERFHGIGRLVGIDLRRVGQSTSKAAGHARSSGANQLELIQCALRVGKGMLARARVGNAISYTSPRYGRLKCLYLLMRYLAKFGLCCSD